MSIKIYITRRGISFCGIFIDKNFSTAIVSGNLQKLNIMETLQKNTTRQDFDKLFVEIQNRIFDALEKTKEGLECEEDKNLVSIIKSQCDLLFTSLSKGYALIDCGQENIESHLSKKHSEKYRNLKNASRWKMLSADAKNMNAFIDMLNAELGSTIPSIHIGALSPYFLPHK